MFKMTRFIYDELKIQNPNLKMFTEEKENRSEVWLEFGIKNGGNYRIRFINTSDNNDTAVRVFNLITVEKNQIARILPVINQLNGKYRFFKFYCDENGEINLIYDFLPNSIYPEKSTMEVLTRVVDIVDTVYPVIMRALWN